MAAVDQLKSQLEGARKVHEIEVAHAKDTVETARKTHKNEIGGCQKKIKEVRNSLHFLTQTFVVRFRGKFTNLFLFSTTTIYFQLSEQLKVLEIDRRNTLSKADVSTAELETAKMERASLQQRLQDVEIRHISGKYKLDKVVDIVRSKSCWKLS